jgi:RNA recognition motif-containing protein
MKKRMYVGNLNYAVTEKELNELFAEFGEVVDAKVITRPDGRSKGFGFVEMAEEDQAAAAIEKLNQSEFMERTMVVNEAREMEKRAPRDNNNGGGRGGYRRREGGGGDDLNYKLRQLRRKFK